MKIFVTGGTGYIGSHTVVELQQNGYDVVIVDNLCNSNIGVLDGIEKITGIRPEFEQIDLTEGEQVRDFFRRHQDKSGYPFCRFEGCGRIGAETFGILPE